MIYDRPATEGCVLEENKAGFCHSNNCDRCGWNKDEQVRRRLLIEKYGLTTGLDGLRYLHLGRKRRAR